MTLARGIVSQVNGVHSVVGDQELAPRLMVDASVSYGASGGGVYDARDGGLIGLVEGYRTARVTSQGQRAAVVHRCPDARPDPGHALFRTFAGSSPRPATPS
jgi:hypothetical protein